MARLTTLVFLLTTVVVYVSAQNGQTANLYCEIHDDVYSARFVLFKNDDDVTNMYAVDDLGGQVPNCSTSDGFITGDGSDDTPFTMLVTWNQDGSADSSSQCGKGAVAGASNKYSWLVETRLGAISNIVRAGERNYKLECDYDKVVQSSPADNPATIQEDDIGGVEITVNGTTETVDFYVGDENGTRATVVQLGSMITLQVELTPNSDGGASGVYATECRACDHATCANVFYTYPITKKETGCLVAKQFIGDEDDQFFTGADPLKSSSIPFSAFRFTDPNSREVYFFCRINFCFGSATDACTDPDSLCATTGRKRRDTDQSKEEVREVKTSVIISNEPLPTKVPRTSEKRTEQVICRSVTMYLALVIALGVLLVVSLAVTIAIFVRVKRLHKTDSC